jgi:hypothetical protein
MAASCTTGGGGGCETLQAGVTKTLRSLTSGEDACGSVEVVVVVQDDHAVVGRGGADHPVDRGEVLVLSPLVQPVPGRPDPAPTLFGTARSGYRSADIHFVVAGVDRRWLAEDGVFTAVRTAPLNSLACPVHPPLACRA